MRVIKRYPNRKLYDTEAKAYITLEGIADLIRAGEDVQVVDHETGEDLTTVTLSQIILEQEKKQQEKKGGTALPKNVLTSLIRTSGDTLDIFKRSFYSSLGAMRTLEEGIEKRVELLVRRGQMSEAEGRELRESLLSHSEDTETEAAEAAGRPMDATFDKLNIPSRSDIQRLSGQLEELTAKLDALLNVDTVSSPEPAETKPRSSPKSRL
jgi:polyhydroxyalkanoate synthesis repressor PhaR